MPSLKRDDVESSLTMKGFTEEPGGDHRYFRLHYEGKKTGIYTKTSRGTGYKSLGDGLELIRSPGQVRKHYAVSDSRSQASNEVGVS